MTEKPSNTPAANKQVVADLIETVWRRGELDRLSEFWTTHCVNHAAPSGADVGLPALHDYHAQFGPFFAGFSDVGIAILQQVGETDRVVTQVLLTARHTGAFMGRAASGRAISLATIRIDRFEDRRIAEHWSVADLAGLLEQIGPPT